MLVSALSICLLCSILYVRHLHKRLKAYEHVWEQIESIADRNQDGSFQIHIQHMQDVQAEAHLKVDDSSPGVRLLDLHQLSTQDGPPRAA